MDLIDLEWSESDPSLMISAFRATDIVLWCTHSFAPQEAGLWDRAPETLKDHSFLILTKADMLAEQALLQPRMTQLSDVAANEFHSLFPTTTAAAMQELLTNETLSDGTRAASGIEILADAVTRLAKGGRQADLDAALLFAAHHGLDVHADTAAQPSRPKALADGSGSDAPLIETTSSQTNPSNGTEIYDTAAALLEDRIAELAAGSERSPDAVALLSQCADISDALTEFVLDSAASEDANTEAWRDDLLQAADRMTLMALESTTAAAADAVGILCQLRTDFKQAKILVNS